MRGEDLLVDMLPRRQRGDKASILPVVRAPSVQSIRSETREDPRPVETEANEHLMPETDAANNEIREMHAGEVAAQELGQPRSRRSLVELEGLSYLPEMQAREVAAAELKVV